MVGPTMNMGKPYSTTSSTTSSTVIPLLTRPKETRKFPTKAFDNFRRDSEQDVKPAVFVGTDGRTYNDKAAASNTANTHLVRILKGRHLQVCSSQHETR